MWHALLLFFLPIKCRTFSLIQLDKIINVKPNNSKIYKNK